MSGFQIIVVRKRTREVPEWAVNNSSIRVLIDRSFPKWRTNKIQRARAGRWVRVIYLYHRQQMSHPHVAEEIGIGYNVLKSVLRSIKRASRGMTTSTNQPRFIK